MNARSLRTPSSLEQGPKAMVTGKLSWRSQLLRQPLASRSTMFDYAFWRYYPLRDRPPDCAKAFVAVVAASFLERSHGRARWRLMAARNVIQHAFAEFGK